MNVAHELARSCFEMYNRSSTGLAPEIVSFNPSSSGIAPPFEPHHDARHSLLRPETVESLFILWRVTHRPIYREWGWRIFQAIEMNARVSTGGYSSLRDAYVG